MGTSAEQWLSTSVQVSASCRHRAAPLFVAEPEYAIWSSTLQVVPAVGVAIVTVGGVPAVIVSESVAESPPGSVTRRRTV